MERCICLAKETGAMPYKNGTDAHADTDARAETDADTDTDAVTHAEESVQRRGKGPVLL